MKLYRFKKNQGTDGLGSWATWHWGTCVRKGCLFRYFYNKATGDHEFTGMCVGTCYDFHPTLRTFYLLAFPEILEPVWRL